MTGGGLRYRARDDPRRRGGSGGRRGRAPRRRRRRAPRSGSGSSGPRSSPAAPRSMPTASRSGPRTSRPVGAADAVLLGAVGGPKWSDPSRAGSAGAGAVRAARRARALREPRPVKVHPALVASSPLRPELLEGVDLLIVRELTGGVYFGERRRQPTRPGERRALDTMPYAEDEIRRVVRLAFELARDRRDAG